MELNVVYSSDDNYAQHVGVSMTSLFNFNKDFKKINIYLIENNITKQNKINLQSICAKYNRSITFIDFNTISHKLRLNIGNTISINAYARLFIASILDENIDKVLYLDSDSIINASLKNLWNIDISGYYVAGVCDTISDQTKEKVKMSVNSPYINSGMLIINLKKWREEYIEEKFIKFINDHNGNVFHHDQGTINGVLNSKFLILPPKYNAMTPFFTMSREEILTYYGLMNYYSKVELEEARSRPIFIHYTPAFVNRPWIKGCKHPFAYLYLNFLELTPWKGKFYKDKRGLAEKSVGFLYNHFSFRIANKITKLVFK